MLVVFPDRLVTDDLGNCQNIGKPICPSGTMDSIDKGFGPFGDGQFSESLPCFSATPDLIIFDSIDFRRRMKAGLPALAADDEYLAFTVQGRMINVQSARCYAPYLLRSAYFFRQSKLLLQLHLLLSF